MFDRLRQSLTREWTCFHNVQKIKEAVLRAKQKNVEEDNEQLTKDVLGLRHVLPTKRYRVIDSYAGLYALPIAIYASLVSTLSRDFVGKYRKFLRLSYNLLFVRIDLHYRRRVRIFFVLWVTRNYSLQAKTYDFICNILRRIDREWFLVIEIFSWEYVGNFKKFFNVWQN